MRTVPVGSPPLPALGVPYLELGIPQLRSDPPAGSRPARVSSVRAFLCAPHRPLPPRLAKLALGLAALVIWHRLQRILGPVGGQYQRLAVTRVPDVAPLHSDVLCAYAEKDQDHYRLDGASIIDIDVLDLADGLIGLVADVRADDGISRDFAFGIEVAGRGRRSRVAVC